MAAVLGKDRLTNPIFGIFYVWWWVGLVPLSLLLGPVYKAISPVRTINAAFAKLSGSDPDKGVFTYPERLGYWPAAARAVRLRLARAGLPLLHRARPGPALVRGVRRRDARRRRPVRQHVLRARRPVRGLLDPGRQAVGLGPPAGAGDPTAGPAGASAARWPTSTPWWSDPGWSASPRCCSAARRSTPSRTRRSGSSSSRAASDRRAPAAGRGGQQPRAAGVLRRGRADLRDRHDADLGRAGDPAPRPARPVRATRSCRSSWATSSPTT